MDMWLFSESKLRTKFDTIQDEDGEWNVLRDDLERWIEKNQ